MLKYLFFISLIVTSLSLVCGQEEDGLNGTETTVSTNDCSLVGLLPFTWYGNPINSYQLPRDNNASTAAAPPYAVTHAAAALLAADHFNARSDIIIPELSNYTSNCSVQINELIIGNSDSREGTASKFILDYYKTRNQSPCAVLGGYASIPTREAAVVSQGLDSVLVSHGAEDGRLTLPRTPEVTRTCAHQHSTGEAIVNWLRSKNRTNFLAVAYTSHEHGVTYSDTVNNAAKETNFTHFVHSRFGPPFTGMEPNKSIRYAMLNIKDSTYRTIVAVLNDYEAQIGILADVAEELEMNSDDYVWIFVLPMELSLDEFVVYSTIETHANISKLVKGSALVRNLDEATLEESEFQQVWEQQDELFVDRLNEMLPSEYAVSTDYFQQYQPEPGAGYMYDAVMAVAMGKCQEEKAPVQGGKGGGGKGAGAGGAGGAGAGAGGAPSAENGNEIASGSNNNDNNEGRRRRTKGERLKKRRLQKKPKKGEVLSPHMKGITSLEFTGVTGPHVWNEKRPRNRQRNLMTWGVYNVREIDTEHRDRLEQRFPTHNFTLWYYLTDILKGGPVEGEWTTTEDGPFLFSDGTPSAPTLLRAIPEQNYLSSSVRIAGLVLMSVSLFFSVLIAFLVWMYQERKIIKNNQPFFLFVLLIGSFLMALSILFLSFDESTLTASELEQEPKFLDFACAAFPWFLSLGYTTIYGALFMKLWRINRVLQARRRTRVDVKHVVWPFVTLVGVSIVILTVWTIVEPWQWERFPVDENEPLGESYGQCTSPNDLVFIIILACIMVTATVLAGLMSWKTKDIDSKFSESSWIFTTIVLQFQVLLVGIPILIIVQQQSADATYMGRVLLIWTITMSTLVLMFGPKLLPILSPKCFRRLSSRSLRGSLAAGSVRVSGIAQNIDNTHNKSIGTIGSSLQTRSTICASARDDTSGRDASGRNYDTSGRNDDASERNDYVTNKDDMGKNNDIESANDQVGTIQVNANSDGKLDPQDKNASDDLGGEDKNASKEIVFHETSETSESLKSRLFSEIEAAS